MARRRPPPEIESAGNDSFLDVLTNIVGILIILVMIVGARARKTIFPDSAVTTQAAEALHAKRREAESLAQDVYSAAHEMESVQREAAARHFERDQLDTFLVAADHDLHERRAALDKQTRKRFDLERNVAQARADLEKLSQETVSLRDTPERTIKIESYPTPLSKPVEDKEAHFQIKHGRIVYVPFNEFVNRLRSIFEEKAQRLRDTNEFTDSLGPIAGFSIRYTIERVDVAWDEMVQTGQGGSYIRLAEFHFLPTSSELGEPVEEALGNHSVFRGRLDDLNPRSYTITLWVYPDSFEEFRLLRKELYQMGYTIAARPMAPNRPIGGSPHGSKSAAQ